jgi:hypothetical protein
MVYSTYSSQIIVPIDGRAHSEHVQVISCGIKPDRSRNGEMLKTNQFQEKKLRGVSLGPCSNTAIFSGD